MILSKFHKFIFSFFVLTPFVCMTGDYSTYYLSYGNVFFSLIVFFLTLTICQEFIDYEKTYYVVVYLMVCLFVLCFHLLASFQMPNVRLLFELLFACSFICLKPFVREWVYDKFIRLLALFFLLAIIEYIVSLAGYTFVLGESVRPGFGYRYYQGIFNLIPYYSNGHFFRFQFIMDEPGRVGTLCFFILITLNKEKYKKEFITFFIAGIISFSLAFYVLIILWGVSMIKPKNLKFLLIPIMLFCVFYEPITDILGNRIEHGFESGTINNRSSLELDALYSDMWMDGSVIYGLGYRTIYGMNIGESAGLKKMIVQYGILGFLLCFGSFSYIFFRYNRVNYSNVVILILFWLSFCQRSDLNFAGNIIALFSYSLTKPEHNQHKYLTNNVLMIE